MSTLALPGTATAVANEAAGVKPDWSQPEALVDGGRFRRGLAAVLAAPQRLMAYGATRRRQRRAVHALESLSDRMLADIGLERCDIDRIVRHGRDASDRRSLLQQLN
jgi:uncharacterized protein YjiS (DUF1127 family)